MYISCAKEYYRYCVISLSHCPPLWCLTISLSMMPVSLMLQGGRERERERGRGHRGKVNTCRRSRSVLSQQSQQKSMPDYYKWQLWWLSLTLVCICLD